MQTFCPERPLAPNLRFMAQKRRARGAVRYDDIDAPIRDTVYALFGLAWCFPMQSCWGHFVSPRRPGQRDVSPLDPAYLERRYHYHIAYVTLCLDDSVAGREGLAALRAMPRAVDPACVQFGCAAWFWGRQVNSYVLQVQPERETGQDALDVSGAEALRLQAAREGLWARLRTMAEAGAA